MSGTKPLSVSDRDRFREGAAAMREAAAKMLLAEERRHGSVRTKDALVTAHTMIRVLPVPAATAEPDYGCKAHDRQGRRCLLQSEHADPCRFTDGAPEAKPAEGAVGWIGRAPGEPLLDACQWGVWEGRSAAEYMRGETDIVRVRVTVEPGETP